jgi:hypothetical protein
MGPLGSWETPFLEAAHEPREDLIRCHYNNFRTKFQNLRDQFVYVLPGHQSKDAVHLPIAPDDIEGALADRACGT